MFGTCSSIVSRFSLAARTVTTLVSHRAVVWIHSFVIFILSSAALLGTTLQMCYKIDSAHIAQPVHYIIGWRSLYSLFYRTIWSRWAHLSAPHRSSDAIGFFPPLLFSWNALWNPRQRANVTVKNGKQRAFSDMKDTGALSSCCIAGPKDCVCVNPVLFGCTNPFNV